MCATVCPSGALYYGPRETVEKMRRETPINTFTFGRRVVTTKVHMMVGQEVDVLDVDVASFVDGNEI
jgi:hypothetical protein